MPERSNLYIKYLIDESGSLTELSKRDYDILSEDQKYNLYQVQNIFKSGDTLNLTLFDKANPTNQFGSDGNKQIFAGGFKFHPVLWRTGSYNLVYEVDENVFPNGVLSIEGTAPTNQFRVEVSYTKPKAFKRSYLKYRVVKIDGGNATEDLTITYNVKIRFSAFNTDTRTYTGTMLTGTNETEWSFESRGGSPEWEYIVNIQRAGTKSQFDFGVEDNSPSLTVDALNNTIISCSVKQSTYYPNYRFSGSNGFTASVDYNFKLSKGDLVRFADNTFTPPTLRQSLEYEIIDVFPPTSSTDILSFKIDRPILDICTSSVSPRSVSVYVFSRKIADETNIVIQHKKKPGQTSGGIVKNANLLTSIDKNVANIVGELKSKIFNTVLIQ